MKTFLTILIGIPGFALVGYLNSVNQNAGAFAALPLIGALGAIWIYKRK
jgi:hypothetical protein